MSICVQKIQHFVRLAFSAARQACAASGALRAVAGLILTACAALLLASPASAQSIIASSSSPTTFSGAGQTIIFSFTVNSGNKVASSATVTSNIGAVYSCPISDTVNTGVTFTCSAAYTTTATDVAATQIQERVDIRLLSFSTPTIMTSPVVTVNFVAPPAPTVTSVSPTSGPTTGGTSVSITGTNFTGATAVTFGGTAASAFTVNSATSITATSPAGTGTVDVSVTTGNGTSATSAADQFTYAAAAVAPTITTNPANQTVNAGQTATFAAAASGTPSPTVQWQFSTNGGASFSNVAGATTTTLTVPNVAAGQNGTLFRAVFTNASGTATTTAATMTVNSAPAVTTNPTNQTVSGGSVVTFTAAASGNPTPTVQWQQSTDGGATFNNIAGATSTTLSFTTTGSQSGNQYRAVFTNSVGSATTTAAALTVNVAPAVTTNPVNQTVNVGGTATFTAAASGQPAPTVQWQFSTNVGASFSNVAGATTTTLTIPNVASGQNGTLFRAVFTNTAGTATTTAATMTVNKLNQTISFTTPAPTTAVVAGAAYTVGANSTSGLTVTLAIDPSATSVCSIAGNSVSFQSVGTCIINANQAGDATYLAAPQVQQSFAVGQGANVITFPALADTSFTSTPPVPAATASSGLTVAYSSSTTGVCTVTTGGSITFVTAGVCTIAANQAGNANFVAASTVSRSFNVTPGINTITFATLTNRALGSGNFTVSATASSGLTVTFSSTTPATCSVSGTTVSLLAVGTCTIAANQAGNGTFQAAPTVNQSFTISKAVSSVALTSSSTTVYFGQPVTLTATVSGVAPTGTVTFSDGATPLSTVALSAGSASYTTSALATGPHSLTASYSGDASNLASNSTAVAVTVNVRPDPSADPDVRSSVDTQFRMSERFARTQMDNIGSRLDQLHGDGDDRDDLAITVSQPGPRQFNRLPGDAAFGRPQGYQFRNNARPGSTDALLTAFDPNAALMPQMPGAPMGYAAAPSSNAVPGGNAMGAAAGPGGRVVHVWANGDVSFGKEQPNGFVETRFTSTGVTVGMDGRASDRLKLGVALGFAWDHSRFGINGSNDDASNSSLAFYGSWKLAPRVYLDGIVGMGYGTIDTTRWSTTGQLFLDGKRRTSQIFAAMIGTAELKAGRLEVAPYVRLDGIWVHLSPYSETGSPTWALTFLSAKEDSLSGSVGTRLRYPLDQDGHWLIVGKAEYRGRLSGQYSQRLGYADLQGVQGSPYVITGQGVSSSTFTGGIGLEARLRTIALRLNYDVSTLEGSNVAQSVSGGVTIKW